ncbi:UTP--glucose-1-phosphate uridylyltransferase GalU [Anaerosacchariphilus polymeriproducens]|uniref:UTP--glucose-1-phosphate uridylyltransferase n=1 Tax=Anaerosacchariphilus polymeriproducens TaxID=1812858 RepID=A0A371AV54_9FIRM|nr:UTP--glucose-1-phosphate uridylyltransferase GalU [Anaerosacchariphilus polymeriproducens]RDU23446.1 UTP--glucose-1-phosphate uridylyltransferase [Anaerosacchariphilus polymeriproducens]
MRVKKAIIPAAGLGTRFLPATKAQPKEMLAIVDKPTIQYIIEEAVASGITDIIIVTGRNKRSIEDHFDRSIELELELERSNKLETLEMVRKISDIANIHYIRQKEPRGLGHAILTAKQFIGNEPFAVLLGDDIVVSKKPCLQQMMEVFDEYKTTVLGVQTVADDAVDKYGIVDCKHIEERVFKVKDLVEKPKKEDAPSNVAILGRYIITPTIFEYLQTQDAGAGGEIQLTDALRRMALDEAMYAYNFKGHRYDVGTKSGFIEANIEFALRNDEVKDDMLEYLNRLHDNMEEMLKYD